MYFYLAIGSVNKKAYSKRIRNYICLLYTSSSPLFATHIQSIVVCIHLLWTIADFKYRTFRSSVPIAICLLKMLQAYCKSGGGAANADLSIRKPTSAVFIFRQ